MRAPSTVYFINYVRWKRNFYRIELDAKDFRLNIKRFSVEYKKIFV